jgi:hypothetical protein
MRSTTLIAALAATATLGVAATAQADTYCVGSPSGCPTTHTYLQPALDAAKAHPGHDVVRIGSGILETASGFKYSPAIADVATNTVEIVGEGDSTVLTGSTPSKSGTFRVLEVNAAGATRVAKLKIVVPDAADQNATPGGLSTGEGVLAEDLTVVDSGKSPLGARYGIDVWDGAIRRSTVTMNDTATAVFVHSQSSATILDSKLRGATGVAAYQGSTAVTVRRTHVTALDAGFGTGHGTMDIDSSFVRVIDDGGFALRLAGGSQPTTLVAGHLTAVSDPGLDNTVGIRGTTGLDGDAIAKVDNAILHGFERGTYRNSTDVGGEGEVFIYGSNVNYDAANDYSGGGGDTLIGTVTNVAPGFVDAAGGDFRLAPKSPLIDKGRFAFYVSPSVHDLAGGLRVVGAKRDLGAYEYQALAPVAVIGGGAGAEAGQALALSGAQSRDGDAGDAIASWSWTFGDGATATGKDVQHVWAEPGTYEVALTVVDTTGKSHTAKTSVVVTAPPVVTSGGGESGGGEVGGPNGGGTPPADTTAPAISGLRRRGRVVRMSLSEAAAVVVKVQRRRGSRYRTVGTAKRLAGRAGANALRIAKLGPGRYRVVVAAVDAAGNRSVKRLAFRVA